MPENATATDSELMAETGLRLRSLRRRRGLTIGEAAKRADLARMTVSRAERGHNPTLLTVVRLLRVYGSLNVLETFLLEPEVSPMALISESRTRGWLK